jgi:prepilin peptidase CpaA
MTNGLLTESLLALLAIILVAAAIIDIRTYTISNRLNLAVALLAPLYWVSIGMGIAEIGIQVAVAVGVFVLLAIAFYLRMMGGGDVKLASAIALWFAPQGTLRFLIYMSVAGGVLTLAVVGLHKLRKKEGKPEIPYGVAIAFGALTILAQRFLNQFA